MTLKKERALFLKLLRSGQLLEVITPELIEGVSKFNYIFDQEYADALLEKHRGPPGTEDNLAPLPLRDFFVHVRAAAILLNRMMVSAKPGKVRKFNSKSIFKFFDIEPVFKASNIRWNIACLVTLVNNGMIRIYMDRGYPLYKITPAGRDLAIQDSVSVIEDPSCDLTEAANKVIKRRKNR